MSARNSRQAKAERKRQEALELLAYAELANYFNALAVLVRMEETPDYELTEQDITVLQAAFPEGIAPAHDTHAG